nr:MAG TPA: hypothetical protein [Caudoviricetes sp.]
MAAPKNNRGQNSEIMFLDSIYFTCRERFLPINTFNL